MAKKKELIVTDAVAVPAYLQGLENDTRGTENVTKSDLVVPRLGLIQALSPQIDKQDPVFIKGAEQGQLFNAVTQEIYGGSVLLVPVLYEKVFNVWRDRKLGGGFGGSYPSIEEADLAITDFDDPNSWDITETPTMLCLILHNNTVSEIAVSMPISKAKVSRQWNSLIRLVEGPSFCRVYELEGVQDTNQANEKYWNYKVSQAGFPSEPVYFQAEALYEEIATGKVKYTVDQEGAEG